MDAELDPNFLCQQFWQLAAEFRSGLCVRHGDESPFETKQGSCGPALQPIRVSLGCPWSLLHVRILNCPMPRLPERFQGRVQAQPSSQFQRRESKQGKNQRQDPETRDDLRLLPAQQLEMMVNGSHSEDALPRQLE